MAVLCGAHFTTGSAPNTAAAPHIALPVDVIITVSLSIFNNLPNSKPSNNVPTITIISITTAEAPIAITCCIVSLNP